MDKNFIRGVLSNVIGVGILAALSRGLHLEPLAALALALNWAVCFVHALPNDSEKFFDATGSLTYFLLICSALVVNGAHAIRQVVNPLMVIVWCLRLGSFLFARIQRDGKDDRFDELKKNWLRFLGVWTIQSIWCFVVSSPALVIVSSEACRTAPGILDYLGWCIWISGFVFEVIADKQKEAFRSDPANKKKFITSGLWAYSRHPNYFGEISMWIGMCVSASSCFQGAEWLGWLSPFTTWLLLMKVSGVPLIEGKGEKVWGQLPEYKWYMQHTPCIFPALTRPPSFKADSYIKID